MIFVANWKMNNASSDFKNFVKRFVTLYEDDKSKKVIFCPSFVDIIDFVKYLKKNKLKRIMVGSQNISHFTNLNNTGEISARMIHDAGARYCIVGHSERRLLFNETDEHINHKIKELISNDINPILCVGETLIEKENKDTQNVIKKQIQKSLKNIKTFKRILIAYEPVWAIGTGKAANNDDISDVNSEIKFQMNKLGYNNDQFYILYGGSVNMSNLSCIININSLDGFLIGGASLNPDVFWDLIKTNKG